MKKRSPATLVAVVVIVALGVWLGSQGLWNLLLAMHGE